MSSSSSITLITFNILYVSVVTSRLLRIPCLLSTTSLSSLVDGSHIVDVDVDTSVSIYIILLILITCGSPHTYVTWSSIDVQTDQRLVRIDRRRVFDRRKYRVDLNQDVHGFYRPPSRQTGRRVPLLRDARRTYQHACMCLVCHLDMCSTSCVFPVGSIYDSVDRDSGSGCPRFTFRSIRRRGDVDVHPKVVEPHA